MAAPSAPSAPPPSVALLTCTEPPEDDPDEALLAEAVRARGLTAEVVPWDAAPAPGAHALWVPRSTWDYHRRLDAFLAFCARTAARSALLNPLHLIRWNAHKGYLRELKQRGVPVIRTAHVARGGAESLAEICAFQGWDDVVIKPAVSAGSRDTRRFRADEMGAGEAFLRTLSTAGDVLVQGYMADVEARGERALVFIDGELTHAVRKSPRLSHQAEEVSPALPIAPEERDLAEMALRPFRERLLYARVDVVRDAHDQPTIMEVELIEPSLFLAQHPPALERFADALVREARRAAGAGRR